MKQLLTLLAILTFSIHSRGQNEGKMDLGRKSPNIILILTDDLGYGDLGILFQNNRKTEGKPYHKTPHLDRLAGEGIILTRHYVPAPVCAPSRASLLLGVHQGHAEVRNNQFDKALSDNHTIASILKQAGYATGLVGKWGLQGLEGQSPKSWEAYPTKRGFDYFFGYVRHVDGHNHYPAHEARARPAVELYYNNKEISDQLKGSYTTDLFTAAAKKWISDQQQGNPDKPFFLELAYDTPHAGLQIAASPYPEGGGLKGGVQWIGEPGRFINTAEESIDDYFHPDYATQDWPEQQKRFASMVRRIDNSVGDIMQLLKDLNIDEETLVIFTSDNGPHDESYGYGELDPTFFDSYGPLDGIKRDTWEGGIRVPTLARWPGNIPSGKKDDTPTGFHDWMPTFSGLAGIPAPARSDGVSLLPLLTGEGTREPGVVYIEYWNSRKTPGYPAFHPSHKGQLRGEMQVIYVDGYKGVRYNIQSAEDDFHIYDTREDPGEKKNLAGTSEFFKNLQQSMKDRVLQVRRSNPSAPRPYDSIPVPAVELPQKTEPGLFYRVFEVATPWTPATGSFGEAATGISDGFNLGMVTREDHIVVEYKSMLDVPASGEYEFTLETDRGALLKIHDATVIDADKGYSRGSAISSKINLEQGYHPIKLIYARGEEGNPLLRLQWSGPGFSNQPINPELLVH